MEDHHGELTLSDNTTGGACVALALPRVDSTRAPLAMPGGIAHSLVGASILEHDAEAEKPVALQRSSQG